MTDNGWSNTSVARIVGGALALLLGVTGVHFATLPTPGKEATSQIPHYDTNQTWSVTACVTPDLSDPADSMPESVQLNWTSGPGNVPAGNRLVDAICDEDAGDCCVDIDVYQFQQWGHQTIGVKPFDGGIELKEFATFYDTAVCHSAEVDPLKGAWRFRRISILDGWQGSYETVRRDPVSGYFMTSMHRQGSSVEPVVLLISPQPSN